MEPIDDLPIKSETESGASSPDGPSPGRSLRPILVAGGVVVAFAATFVGYLVLRGPAPVQPAATATAKGAPLATTDAPSRQTLGPTAEPIELPPLESSDPLVRKLVRALSSDSALMAWLATDGLIRNFVTCVENVAGGQTPARQLRVLAPKAPFRAETRNGRITIDPRSYSRYDTIADALAGLDPDALARTYSILKPRLVEAYRELGHPDGDIDGAMVAAITVLLGTPPLPVSAALTQKAVAFKFAQADLESLPPAQKQLLRMGPRNARLVQDALRAIAKALGIPPDRLTARRAGR